MRYTEIGETLTPPSLSENELFEGREGKAAAGGIGVTILKSLSGRRGLCGVPLVRIDERGCDTAGEDMFMSRTFAVGVCRVCVR